MRHIGKRCSPNSTRANSSSSGMPNNQPKTSLLTCDSYEMHPSSSLISALAADADSHLLPQTAPNIRPKRDTTQSVLGTLHYYSYISSSAIIRMCVFWVYAWFWLCCECVCTFWECVSLHVRTVRTHSFCIVFLDNHSYQLLMFCLIILIFNSFAFRVNLINSSRLHFT